MKRGISLSRHPWHLLVFTLLWVLFLLFPLTAQSDELGEFLLKEIKANPPLSAAKAGTGLKLAKTIYAPGRGGHA